MRSPSPVAVALRRTGVASALMVGSALGAHVAAGGTLPPAPVLLVLIFALVSVGAVVAGGQVGRWSSLALVAVSQYAVHELLVMTAGWSAASGPGLAGTCHVGHGREAFTECAGAGDIAHSAADVGAVDLKMLLIHALATVVTGWLLAVGDRVAATAWSAIRPLWQTCPVPPVEVLGSGPRWVAGRLGGIVTSLVCVEHRPRRGPPRVARVAPTMTA